MATVKNKQISVNAMIVVVIIFVAAIAGTLIYFNQMITQKNSEIASLNAQLDVMNSQVSNLNKPNLVTSLSIGVQQDATVSVNGVEMTGNALYIDGSITNQGKTTAYNVKLNVVAKDVYGSTVVDMTVPVWGNFVPGEDPSLLNSGNPVSINPIQTMNYVNIKILCQSVPVTWNITPVCANSP
jgi:hypothetical protein